MFSSIRATKASRKSLFSCLFTAFLLLQSCGGKYAKERISTSLIKVSGEISLRGSSPFPILILETPHGENYILHAANDLFNELKRLSGMRANVEGILNNASSSLPSINVRDYELLPLKTGELPIVGFIEVDNGNCYLAVNDGNRLQIKGEFAETLHEFGGAKVWVIGNKQGEDILFVVGYGILRPAS